MKALPMDSGLRRVKLYQERTHWELHRSSQVLYSGNTQFAIKFLPS